MPIALVNATGRVPVKCWTPDIEPGALAQALNIANLPFIYKHLALMPDVHQGYGMPIGGVAALEGVVSPNMVGVDIGCGMAAVNTGVPRAGVTDDQLKAFLGMAREAIPVGKNHHREAQAWDGFDDAPDVPIIRQQLTSARCQLGTLGGGNHFAELQQDADGMLWLMLHSGSRNLGKQVADHYNKIAKNLNARWHSSVPPSVDLAFLPVETLEGQEYLAAMKFCLRFAHDSRGKMLVRLLDAVSTCIAPLDYGEVINAHHNYAAPEHHFGKNVWVHRKGAIRARAGEIGIIPGSMGTCSYIVRGLGEPMAFTSASHGAGRHMSRSEANKTYTEAQATAAMGDVIFGRWNGDVSESPLAYKDIDVVMANQTDLVEIVTRLTPVAVLKG
jgi:tRNA-splicing ligase RtcB